MSKERAKKFCKLCHHHSGLIDKLIKTAYIKDYDQDLIEYYQLRDNATAEAMKALEEFYSVPGAGEHYEATLEMLERCNLCDYSKPTIADLLEKKGE